ncbi:MAG: single-stranded DNA-binding protein [Sulfurovum sp.]
MYNKTIIAGHLTRDIEIKYSSGGMAIGNSGIASTRKFKTQTGEQKEEVLFVDITFFGRTAEIANQYLRKGSKVLVDGRLKLDQWTAQDGTKRSKHSITVENMTMLGNKGETETVPMSDGGYGNSNQAGATEGYNNPPAQPQNNYSQPAPTQPIQQTTQQPTQQQQMPQSVPQQPASSVPVIDINEDEIPF